MAVIPELIPKKFTASYSFSLKETEPNHFRYFETRVKDELADWLVANDFEAQDDFYSNFKFLRNELGQVHLMSQEIQKPEDGFIEYVAKLK
jgi:hypothetical protein